MRFNRRLVPAYALIFGMLSACPFASGDDAAAPYVPTPEILAARKAFRGDRFGIFIHWGCYSVLGRGEWVMNNEKITVADYEPIAARFNPEKFDAGEWVALFKRAGAKYMTITSKHHDGFAMWDSAVSDWDVVERTPWKQDPLKQLADQCAKQDLKLFFYHSQLDWHHPDYFPRGATGGTAGRPESGEFPKYLDYMDAQLTELLSGKYGRVAGIWFDGWWDQQTKNVDKSQDADPLAANVDWRLRRTYDLIHSHQPGCLVGANHHVRPFPGEDFQMFERDLPGENHAGFNTDSKIGELPLETCDTINGAWGYNADDQGFKSVAELISYLVKAAGRDANFLLNVGPRPDGTIDPESAQRLEGIGKWLEVHGESIYGTRGGPLPPQSWGVATQNDQAVFLHVLNPEGAVDGWLTLAGTESLFTDSAKAWNAPEGTEVRRADDGAVKVRLPSPAAPDVIVRIAK